MSETIRIQADGEQAVREFKKLAKAAADVGVEMEGLTEDERVAVKGLAGALDEVTEEEAKRLRVIKDLNEELARRENDRYARSIREMADAAEKASGKLKQMEKSIASPAWGLGRGLLGGWVGDVKDVLEIAEVKAPKAFGAMSGAALGAGRVLMTTGKGIATFFVSTAGVIAVAVTAIVASLYTIAREVPVVGRALRSFEETATKAFNNTYWAASRLLTLRWGDLISNDAVSKMTDELEAAAKRNEKLKAMMEASDRARLKAHHEDIKAAGDMVRALREQEEHEKRLAEAQKAHGENIDRLVAKRKELLAEIEKAKVEQDAGNAGTERVQAMQREIEVAKAGIAAVEEQIAQVQARQLESFMESIQRRAEATKNLIEANATIMANKAQAIAIHIQKQAEKLAVVQQFEARRKLDLQIQAEGLDHQDMTLERVRAKMGDLITQAKDLKLADQERAAIMERLNKLRERENMLLEEAKAAAKQVGEAMTNMAREEEFRREGLDEERRTLGSIRKELREMTALIKSGRLNDELRVEAMARFNRLQEIHNALVAKEKELKEEIRRAEQEAEDMLAEKERQKLAAIEEQAKAEIKKKQQEALADEEVQKRIRVEAAKNRKQAIKDINDQEKADLEQDRRQGGGSVQARDEIRRRANEQRKRLNRDFNAGQGQEIDDARNAVLDDVTKTQVEAVRKRGLIDDTMVGLMNGMLIQLTEEQKANDETRNRLRQLQDGLGAVSARGRQRRLQAGMGRG